MPSCDIVEDLPRTSATAEALPFFGFGSKVFGSSRPSAEGADVGTEAFAPRPAAAGIMACFACACSASLLIFPVRSFSGSLETVALPLLCSLWNSW